MGPLMLDLVGLTLTEDETLLLENPLVGGVILFTRNFESREQISQLIKDIRNASPNDILIAVDHEGGRVQRFKSGFTHIPAMGDIYPYAQNDLEYAQSIAEKMGWLMASEAIAAGIDISFAPVLDVWGISEVIGDRSFHAEPDLIIPLASAFIGGMKQAGMKPTGKHFPGHGSVKEDSHIAMPIDERPQSDIFDYDMKVFSTLFNSNMLDAVMPAHVIYPDVDDQPAGFSKVWINNILRNDLGFDGVVFSDDLSMEGAVSSGSFSDRTDLALEAGCDMVLVCNNRVGAEEVLNHLTEKKHSNYSKKLEKLLKSSDYEYEQLISSNKWIEANELAIKIHSNQLD